MGAQTHSGSGLLEDVGLPDRYRVLRRIARGGMGTVWRAEDLLLGRRVAIKLLAEQFIDDERSVRRFKREARTAARLSGHPNVVTIYDVGQTVPADDRSPGRPFIVMEHLAGGTVGDAMRAHAVDRESAIRWIAQAAAALDYAHRRGIVHRDIKPGNLLLDGERVLHVADFGIARIGIEDTTTAAGQLLGTAAYISPEQALGNPATEASDRYALAVVAFELLVGQRPFTADQLALQARQHVEADPPLASTRNPTLPPDVDPVLIRGMAKRPDERWPSAGAFAQALRAALHEQHPIDPIMAAPTAGEWTPRITNRRRRPASAEPRRRPRPRPRATALAALAATAFAVGAAVGASGAGSGGGSGTHQHISGTRGGGGSGTDQHVSAAATGRQAPGRPRTPASHARNSAHRRPAHPSRPAATSHTDASTTARTPTTPPTTTPPTTTPPTTTQPTTTGTPASSPATPPTADALEARGHQLMLEGRYSQAIGVLRQAVSSAAPGSLTYAYAEYDLGRTLRLSGDPGDAVPVLQRRLHIPNQTSVVRHELALALKALGRRAASGAAAGSSGR